MQTWVWMYMPLPSGIDNKARNIKYFDIICNDIFGIAIFGKNIYDLSVVYVVGILQSILGMFILDFYPGLMKYAEMKGEEIKKKN